MMWHDALVKQLIKVKAGGSREEKNDVWQIVSAQGVEDDPGGPVLGVTSRNLSTPPLHHHSPLVPALSTNII